jgi:hypothetical protein
MNLPPISVSPYPWPVGKNNPQATSSATNVDTLFPGKCDESSDEFWFRMEFGEFVGSLYGNQFEEGPISEETFEPPEAFPKKRVIERPIFSDEVAVLMATVPAIARI